MDTLEIFVVTAPGLEAFAAQEARDLNFTVTETIPGGVSLSGTWHDVWRANLELRGATRILVRIAAFRAMHLAQLDKRAKKLPWQTWLGAETTVRVEATCRKSRIYHAKAATQRIEGALKAAGIPTHPKGEISVKLRIDDDLATFSLDTSGISLHKRGQKERVNKAPMRESLAALFLRAAGFNGAEAVYDPMCGSGTFLLEAAEIANNRQAGRARSFAFETFSNFEPDTFATLKREPGVTTGHLCFGSDRDQGAVHMVQVNAAAAGLEDVIAAQHASVSDARPPEGPPGLVITNPPYGGRIGNKGVLHGLYGAFGKSMRENFKGWRVAMVTSDAGLAKSTALSWQTPGPIVDHGGTKIRLWQTQL